MSYNAVMALNLYRRHRRDCKAGHPEELRSGEFDERKKGWKRCSCPIFASGTLQGEFGSEQEFGGMAILRGFPLTTNSVFMAAMRCALSSR